MRRNQFRSLSIVVLFALLFAAAPPSASAQSNRRPTPRIQGRVVGPDGHGVDRALVRIFELGSPREIGRVYTDPSGKFGTTIFRDGDYDFEVDPLGHPHLAKARQAVVVNSQFFNAGALDVVFVNFFLKARAVPKEPELDPDVLPESRADYDRAVALLATNRDEAFAALRKALQLSPGYYEALELLGVEYAKDEYFDEAYVLLTKAVRVDPDRAKAHYGLGVVYYAKKLYDRAIPEFERANALAPDGANTMLYLGLAQARAGQDAKAEASLKRASSLGAKGVPDLHFALAEIYRKTNRKKQAAKELRTLLDARPNLKDAEKIRQVADRLARGA